MTPIFFGGSGPEGASVKEKATMAAVGQFTSLLLPWTGARWTEPAGGRG
jgi:hypothetical protein